MGVYSMQTKRNKILVFIMIILLFFTLSSCKANASVIDRIQEEVNELDTTGKIKHYVIIECHNDKGMYEGECYIVLAYSQIYEYRFLVRNDEFYLLEITFIKGSITSNERT